MKRTIFKIGNLIYFSQAELAYALDISHAALRMKVSRAGGLKKIKSITVNEHTVLIKHQLIKKL